MKTWRDRTFGKYGQWVWISALAPFILGGMFIWLSFFPKHAPTIANWVILGVLFLAPAIWACYYISQIRKALQEIGLDGDRLLGKFFTDGELR